MRPPPIPIESFSSEFWPADWTQQKQGSGITNRWVLAISSSAGGSPNEMWCLWESVNPGTSRLVTPPIDTTGYNLLNLKFKH